MTIAKLMQSATKTKNKYSTSMAASRTLLDSIYKEPAWGWANNTQNLGPLQEAIRVADDTLSTTSSRGMR